MGWVHTPANGRSRGGVVICAPFGKEYLSAYPSLRVLAERLSSAGMTALRFDYAATGDSAGDSTDADQVEGWLSSIVDAADFLRRIGCADVAVVGMRMGATLAATASSRLTPLAALVLWDPCASGKAYLREQKTLHRITLGPSSDADDGSVETPGEVYDAQTVADLARVSIDRLDPTLLPPLPDRGQRVLLLPRPERRGDRLVQTLASSDAVRTEDAAGQAELLDVRSYAAITPDATIGDIAGFLSEHLAGDTTIDHQPATEAVVARTPGGRPIIERFVSLGPDHLFGIRTQLATTEPRMSAPLLVSLNVAIEHHVGPARLWVTLGRQVAEWGIDALRFDRSGVGDSVSRFNSATQSSYTGESVRDTVAAVAGLRASDDSVGDIALLGLCSGAWVASVAARKLAPRSVTLINQGIWTSNPHPLDGRQLVELDAAAERSGDDDQAVLPWRTRIKGRLPYPAWLLLGQLGKAQVPEALLNATLQRGASVNLAFAGPEYESFVAQRGDTAVRRLARSRRIRCVQLARSDHALLYRPGRDAAVKQIQQWLREDLLGVRPESSSIEAGRTVSHAQP